jgi:hypothetical protein
LQLNLKSIMATSTLLSLPNELIVVIISHSTVQTATRLARANKELQANWLKHRDKILKRMFQDTLPASAHQDAYDFASDQASIFWREQMINPRPSDSVKQELDAPTYGRLLRDALLANMTIASWCELPHTHIHTDGYGSYYFIRKLVMAGRYQNEPLEHALLSALGTKKASTKTVMSHVDLCNFICGYARLLEPGVKHGVWIPEPVEDDESDEGEDEPDDAEDQSGDGEDGSGDSEEESDGDEGGFTPKPFYDGRA